MPIAIYREDGLASSTAIKGPCRAATTANIILSDEQTIDGIAVVTGDRVLVKDQTSAIENGIYVVDTGTWRRASDFEGNRDVRKGTRVVVTDGTTNGRTEWSVNTDNPIIVDTAEIEFLIGEGFGASITAQEAADAAEAALALALAAQAAAEAAAASAGTANPTGMMAVFGGNVAPTGWLKCGGTASRTTYPALFAYLVTNSGWVATTFTVTIASPAVFTRAGHGFNGGERVRLSTTGTLPTGLNTTTDYWVVYIDANTFNLSATFGGSVINTTGSQSGTHSYLQSSWGLGDGSTTFNLPDPENLFLRGASATRAVGSRQAESIGPHTHTGTTDSSGSHRHTTGNNTSGPIGSGYSYVNTSVGGAYTGYDGVHTHTFTTAANSGAENRPANTAGLWCIKT